MATLSSFGAVPDAQQIVDGAMTLGSATLTSAAGKFDPADVGKSIAVAGAGPDAAKLLTTIASYVSVTEVVLTEAAGAAVVDTGVTWGTDCGAALQAAFEALAEAYGGALEIDGYYMLVTPASYNFLNQATQVYIRGFGSNSGIYPAVAAGAVAITIQNCEMVYLQGVNFAGTPQEHDDVFKLISLEWCHTFVEKCGFYGLASISLAGGCIVGTTDGQLHLSENRFGGCACSSGLGNAVVDMQSWFGFSSTRDQFLDYGLFRGTIHTKTGIVFPYAQVKIGDQFSMEASAMWQGVVRITDSRFDEGVLNNVAIVPSTGQRVNRVHIDGAQFNVTAIAGFSGIYATQVDELVIERCAFGLSPTPHDAITIADCRNVVIDAIDTAVGVNGLKASNVQALTLRNSPDLTSLDFSNVGAFRHEILGFWNAPVFSKAGRPTSEDFPAPPTVGTLAWDTSAERLYIKNADSWYFAQAEIADPYGPELVVNGTFDTDVAGWTVNANGALTWVSGAARLTATGLNPLAYQAVTTQAGETYRATYSKVGGSGTPVFRIGAGPGEADILNTGTSGEITFVATHPTTYIAFIVSTPTVGISADFDGFSMRRLIED